MSMHTVCPFGLHQLESDMSTVLLLVNESGSHDSVNEAAAIVLTPLDILLRASDKDCELNNPLHKNRVCACRHSHSRCKRFGRSRGSAAATRLVVPGMAAGPLGRWRNLNQS